MSYKSYLQHNLDIFGTSQLHIYAKKGLYSWHGIFRECNIIQEVALSRSLVMHHMLHLHVHVTSSVSCTLTSLREMVL